MHRHGPQVAQPVRHQPAGRAEGCPAQRAPPVLAGVRDPKSLELVGHSADGVILAWPVTPAYIRHAAGLIARGRRTAARSGQAALLAGTPISLGPDKAAAAESLRPLVAAELASPSSRAHLEATGLAQKVNELRAECGSMDEFAAQIPREWIMALTVRHRARLRHRHPRTPPSRRRISRTVSAGSPDRGTDHAPGTRTASRPPLRIRPKADPSAKVIHVLQDREIQAAG